MSESAYHQAPSGPGVPPPSGCPVDHHWSPLSADYLADPYTASARMRAEGPAFYSAELGYLVINRMADIDAVFVDHETYASSNVQDPLYPLSDAVAQILAPPDFAPIAVMSNRSQPDHGRIRVHTRQGFSNRRLKTIEPFISARTETLIDEMLASGSPAEFVKALAYPLPGETVFRFIGFPAKDDEHLKQWCLDRKSFAWGHPTDDEQIGIASQLRDYWQYCCDFVADKRDNRGDDFTSELLNAHDADQNTLTYREIESIIYGLSFAGHEAVTALLCNALLCLLPRPDQWNQLCANPSLIDNTIEEVLRFESSQVSWRRVTTRPTTLAGYDLPTGTKIFLNFAAANREPDYFENPDQFDIHRTNAKHHISFGKGIHFCLGAMLAKVEARIVVGALARRIPSLRLVPDQHLTHFPNITFRGPERLLLEWSQ